METKKHLITMILALIAMFMGTQVMADEAYAVYDSSNQKLTFYYDTNRGNWTGEQYVTYDLNTGNNEPGWYTDHKSDIQKAEIDESFKNARPTSTVYWFSCYKLTELIGLHYLNTSEVTDMSYMFCGCKLSTLNLIYFDTSKVTNMEYMFSSCSKLINVNVSSFDTSKVTNMTRMFNFCTELTYLNLASFDTQKISDTGFVEMFLYCSKLQTIYVNSDWFKPELGCIMFAECSQLVGGEGTHYEERKYGSEFARVDGGDSKPGYFTQIPSGYAVFANGTLTFYNDGKMSMKEGEKYLMNVGMDIPLWYKEKESIKNVVFDSSFAEARPITTYGWFTDGGEITEIEGMQYLNTSEVTNMEIMFSGCGQLTSIDLSYFDTQKVTSMRCMFLSCVSLQSLNLQSFNTSNVTDMGGMFMSCTHLKTIYVGTSWNTDNVTESSEMFLNCWNQDGGHLEGEQGTKCVAGEWDTYDFSYAHIDGVGGPGYLSSIKTYNLRIDGVQVTSVNNNNIGGGSFSYDPSANKLTINKSFSSSSSNDIINNAIPGLAIYIPTEVTLSSSEEISIIKTSQPLRVTGSGCLTLTGTNSLSCGIDVSEGSAMSITNANLVIQCGYGIQGSIFGTKESLVVTNSRVEISSVNGAIGYFGGGIYFEDCNITSPTDWNVDDNGSIITGYSFAKDIVITRDSNISTDIDDSLRDSVKGQRDGWYTIDGRKLNGKPTKKGVYINNGKAVVR